MKTSGFRVRVGRVPKWTRAYIQVAAKKCSYMTHSYREAEGFTKSLRPGVTTRLGRVDDQGALRDAGFAAGSLGLDSLRTAGGESAEVSRVSLAEVVLDGRRGASVCLGRPHFNRRLPRKTNPITR